MLIFPFSDRPAFAGKENQLVIGIASSLNTMEGRESRQAAELAMEEINRRGGVTVRGRRYRLKPVSLDLDEPGALIRVSDHLKQLEHFITTEKVHSVIVGPFRSEVLLPAMEIFARHKTILLETIAMSSAMEAEVIRNADYRYIYRTGLNTAYLADMLIEVMKHLRKRFGFSKVYIITQDVAWARSTTALMIRLYFDRKGWRLVGADQFTQGSTNFTTTLAHAKEAGAEVIVPIFDMPQSTFLVEQWHQMKMPAMLCGFISPITGAKAWPATGGKVAGTLNVVFELGNLPSSSFAPATDFYRNYTERYGRRIQSGHGPAPAYESVYLLAEAIEKAAALAPRKVTLALESSDRVGTMGRLRFNRGHQIIFGSNAREEAVACLFQWTRDGQRRIVFPPSLAEGEIQDPRKWHPSPPQ